MSKAVSGIGNGMYFVIPGLFKASWTESFKTINTNLSFFCNTVFSGMQEDM